MDSKNNNSDINQFADDIRQAIDVMNRGGIIAYPTDTIWGLGCDATNADAVRRIYEIKRRDDSKALITLVDSEAKVEFYVKEVPEVAWQLIEVAEDGSIAIRVTAESFSHELCRRFKKALVSTSANISGEPSPKTFADISPEILEAVDYVCTSRRDENAPQTPSSIIKLGVSGEVKVIR